MKLKNIALGSIWDPLAVKLCHKAGENKEINLNFGSKIMEGSGGPIQKKVLVKKNKKKCLSKIWDFSCAHGR